MSINVPIPSHSDSENIDPSSLFALPLASVDDEEQQGELKDKGKRKKHNWKEMENTDELKSWDNITHWIKSNGFAKFRINKGFYADVHTYECSKVGCERQIRVTENFVPPFFHFEDNQDPHDPAAHSDQERPRGMSLRQKMIIDRCLDEYNRSQSKFITIQMNQYNEMVPPNERVAIPSRNCIRNYINYQKQLKKRKRGDVAKSEVV